MAQKNTVKMDNYLTVFIYLKMSLKAESRYFRYFSVIKFGFF